MPCGLWRPAPGPRSQRGPEAPLCAGMNQSATVPQRAVEVGHDELDLRRDGPRRPWRTAPLTRSRSVRRLRLVSFAVDDVVELVDEHLRNRLEAEPLINRVRAGVTELGVQHRVGALFVADPLAKRPDARRRVPSAAPLRRREDSSDPRDATERFCGTSEASGPTVVPEEEATGRECRVDSRGHIAGRRAGLDLEGTTTIRSPPPARRAPRV